MRDRMTEYYINDPAKKRRKALMELLEEEGKKGGSEMEKWMEDKIRFYGEGEGKDYPPFKRNVQKLKRDKEYLHKGNVFMYGKLHA